VNWGKKLETKGVYTDFVLAILVIPHWRTIRQRLDLLTISWPSIFHARAWLEFQSLAREYMQLTMLTDSIKEKK
jgi:hypothetical protein